jgi:beta-phosphoglucomutase
MMNTVRPSAETPRNPDGLLRGVGVLLDIDGVLIDSYDAHFRAWQIMLHRHGFDVTEEQFVATFGRTNADIFRGQYPSLREQDYAALSEEKEAAFREILLADFPAMDGASELIAALHAASAVLAVGSSAPPKNVQAVLNALDGAEHIASWTHGEEVARGKPDPEVYVTAAGRIGIPPRRCVVVEDAPAGVSAGKAAGCKVVALVGTAPREKLGQADWIVDSLREITPARVRDLVNAM